MDKNVLAVSDCRGRNVMLHNKNVRLSASVHLLNELKQLKRAVIYIPTFFFFII